MEPLASDVLSRRSVVACLLFLAFACRDEPIGTGIVCPRCRDEPIGTEIVYPRCRDEPIGTGIVYPRCRDEPIGTGIVYPRCRDEPIGTEIVYPRCRDEPIGTENIFPTSPKGDPPGRMLMIKMMGGWKPSLPAGAGASGKEQALADLSKSARCCAGAARIGP